MVAIDNMIENIRYKSQILARTNKMDSSVTATGVIGFVLGYLCYDPDCGPALLI